MPPTDYCSTQSSSAQSLRIGSIPRLRYICNRRLAVNRLQSNLSTAPTATTQRTAEDSHCPIKFVLCGQVALLQLADFLLEPHEFRLLARDGAVRVVQGRGEGYSGGVEVVEVLCMLLGRRHAGWARRGRAQGLEDGKCQSQDKVLSKEEKRDPPNLRGPF